MATHLSPTPLARLSAPAAGKARARATAGAAAATLLLAAATAAFAQTENIGDLDRDGRPTVRDVVRLVNHLQGAVFLGPDQIPLADINQDTFVTSEDIEALTDVILERTPFQEFPLLRAASFSPADGESGVAVTRETVVRFTLPLAEDAVVNTDNFKATFAGENILSRAEVSSDRLKATLFYLERLPSSARVRVTFDGAGVNDFLGRPVDPDGDGVPGGVARVDFDTLSITTVADTAVVGTVYDAALGPGLVQVPLAGVIIEVVGDEENTRTTTAADGTFTLGPTPSGRFFVNVDGRPVTGQFPGGDYYPFVTKAWEAMAGKADNLVNGTGEVFLPKVLAGSLQAVSPVETTEVTFPEAVTNPGADPDGSLGYDPAVLEGTMVMVPPNALFSDDGTRGGMVGIAPVAPDRLPEPLPEGLQLPLVITVQTDGGSNFDQPVPVRFPNLPDPVTGEVLPPGARTSLMSFNHDKGTWEVAGPATVSADGKWAETDPGVGIRQPGWHGLVPGCPGTGAIPEVFISVLELLEEPDPEEDCLDQEWFATFGPWRCLPLENVVAGSFTSDAVTICAGGSAAPPPIGGTAFEGGGRERDVLWELVCFDDDPPELLDSFSDTEEEAVIYTPVYTWVPDHPSGFDFSYPGVYTFSAQVTFTSPECPDVGPFRVDGTFTVEVVDVVDIFFSAADPGDPPLVPRTVQARAVTEPAGRPVIWSLGPGAPAGTSINAASGLITLGGGPGQIIVVATDAEVPDCEARRSLCDNFECCPEIEGPRQFGPVTVLWGGRIPPLGGFDDDGYCDYETGATVLVETLAPFPRAMVLNGATVSWSERPENGAFKDVLIAWVGFDPVAPFGVVGAEVGTAFLEVDALGSLTGNLEFGVDHPADVKVGRIAWLTDALDGFFTYTYDGLPSFDGVFDFSGVVDYEVELRKGGVAVGRASAPAFDADGNIIGARFRPVAPGDYMTNGFSASVNQLDLGSDFFIGDTAITFSGGTGQVAVGGITDVTGEFLLDLTFTPATVSADVDFNNTVAFGADLGGTGEANFDYAFDLDTITGMDVTADHPDFDGPFGGGSFDIFIGDLFFFDLGPANRRLGAGPTFSFDGAVFFVGDPALEFGASVILPGVQLDVFPFTVDTGGNVAVGNAVGRLDRPSVRADLNVPYNRAQNAFAGPFTGQFGRSSDGVMIAGGAAVGGAPFNYAGFSFEADPAAAELGSSGLVVEELTGEFGLNYLAPENDGAAGAPQLGENSIGFLLALSDVAGLAHLDGFSHQSLDDPLMVTLSGPLDVPANASNRILGGDLSAMFQPNRYSGAVNSGIEVPADSGEVLEMSPAGLDFLVSNRRYSARGRNLVGDVLGAVQAAGSGGLVASLDAPNSPSGNFRGTADSVHFLNYRYPAGFDSTNCATAMATGNSGGFGIEGELALHLGGNINARFGSRGFQANLQVSGSAPLRVKWPCVICADDCVRNETVDISGTIQLQGTSEGIRGTGRLTFSAGGESEEGLLEVLF